MNTSNPIATRTKMTTQWLKSNIKKIILSTPRNVGKEKEQRNIYEKWKIAY